MKVRRTGPEYDQWPEVLTLLQTAFVYMEARLEAPSPVAALTVGRLVNDATEGAAFVIESQNRPVACLFTRPSRDWPGAYYIGKLAVDEGHRGQGLARMLIDAADAEARRLGFGRMVLDTGAALTELHAIFLGLGFNTVEPKDGVGTATSGVVTMAKDLT